MHYHLRQCLLNPLITVLSLYQRVITPASQGLENRPDRSRDTRRLQDTLRQARLPTCSRGFQVPCTSIVRTTVSLSPKMWGLTRLLCRDSAPNIPAQSLGLLHVTGRRCVMPASCVAKQGASALTSQISPHWAWSERPSRPRRSNALMTLSAALVSCSYPPNLLREARSLVERAVWSPAYSRYVNRFRTNMPPDDRRFILLGSSTFLVTLERHQGGLIRSLIPCVSVSASILQTCIQTCGGRIY